MIRMTYKPRTHHRDAYGHGDTTSMLLRVNGRDLLDRATAATPYETPQQAAKRLAPTPKRRLSDAEVAERTHYAKLAAKYEIARSAA